MNIDELNKIIKDGKYADKLKRINGILYYCVPVLSDKAAGQDKLATRKPV